MTRRHRIPVRFVFIFLCLVGGLASTVLAGQGRGAVVSHDSAETVVFRQGQDGYAGCQDTRISEEKPNSNFADDELVLGMKGRANILIRFDVSSIPAHALVQEAALSLFAANGGQDTPLVAGAFNMVRSWEETQATWYQATYADAWALPGCNDTVVDRAATPLDIATLSGRDQWYTWDVTGAVQQWVQDPAVNLGLLIQQTNLEVGGEFDIRQSEYSGLDVRPYLEVGYTLEPPTPTKPPPTEVPPCVGTPEPGAVLTILQQGGGYSGAEDTMLDFDDRETSHAGEWFMRVGYRKHYSGLIKYDVSGLPAGSRIVCAALSLFAERWSAGPLEIGAYYVKRENSILEATWAWAAPGVAWQEGGCNGPDDREQSPESVILVDSLYAWHNLDLTRAVDGWVNGTLANNGVSLQAADRLDDDTAWFTASDDATIANRPKLVVLFVPPPGWVPTATPTPTMTPTPTTTRTPSPTPTSGPPLTTTLQNGLQGYAGCSDTRITAEAPMLNCGESELKAGARQGIATLIQFDVSSIPSTAHIQSAHLQVYGYHREGGTRFELGAFAVKRAWSGNHASWSGATPSTSWGVPGCNDVLTDRAESATDRTTIDSAGWHSWEVTADVQRMVGEPATNAGWILMQVAAERGVVTMHSSEYGNATLRPKLVVTYTLP